MRGAWWAARVRSTAATSAGVCPADFDDWGLPGWTWADVLPHFRAIETDVDFGGPPCTGRTDRSSVRRIAEYDGCTAAFVQAAGEAGYAWVDDLNGGSRDEPVPRAWARYRSTSTAGTRRDPGARSWRRRWTGTNLTLLTGTRASDGYGSSGGRATGVEVVGLDGRWSLTADRIVLCAGAIGSAHLLMLSGVGRGDRTACGGSVRWWRTCPGRAHCADHPEWVLPVDMVGAARSAGRWRSVLSTAEISRSGRTPAGFGRRWSAGGRDGHRRPAAHRCCVDEAAGPVAASRWPPPIRTVRREIEHRYDSEPADVARLTAGSNWHANWPGRQRKSGLSRRGRRRSTWRAPHRWAWTPTRARWWTRSAGCAVSRTCGWWTARCCPRSPAGDPMPRS